MNERDEVDEVREELGQKTQQYVTMAMMAAEAIMQIAALKAREAAARDEQAAAAARAEVRARYNADRMKWQPLFDQEQRQKMTVVDAGMAWAVAQGWRGDLDADRASDSAEDLLRELRPDVMARYDELRASGQSPIDAMREVAPLFDAPPVRTGEAAPARSELGVADWSDREAGAQLVPMGPYVGDGIDYDQDVDQVAFAIDEQIFGPQDNDLLEPGEEPAASRPTTAGAGAEAAGEAPVVTAGETVSGSRSPHPATALVAEGSPVPLESTTKNAATAAASKAVGSGGQQASKVYTITTVAAPRSAR
ncbi:hypothetical protein NUM3379_34980 [Kineococcus sp. NUM-3379]